MVAARSVNWAFKIFPPYENATRVFLETGSTRRSRICVLCFLVNAHPAQLPNPLDETRSPHVPRRKRQAVFPFDSQLLDSKRTPVSMTLSWRAAHSITSSAMASRPDGGG